MQKVRPLLRTLIINQIVGGAIFLLITIALGVFMINHIQQTLMLISAFVLQVFSVIGWIGSINQWSTISRIDYAMPITQIRQKLQKFKIDMLQYIRLLMLSIPFYLSYIILGFHTILDIDLFTQADQKWWVAQIIFSLILVPVAIWLYRKIHYRNIHIPWIKNLVESAGGKSVAQAMVVLRELEKFEQN